MQLVLGLIWTSVSTKLWHANLALLQHLHFFCNTNTLRASTCLLLEACGRHMTMSLDVTLEMNPFVILTGVHPQ